MTNLSSTLVSQARYDWHFELATAGYHSVDRGSCAGIDCTTKRIRTAWRIQRIHDKLKFCDFIAEETIFLASLFRKQQVEQLNRLQKTIKCFLRPYLHDSINITTFTFRSRSGCGNRHHRALQVLPGLTLALNHAKNREKIPIWEWIQHAAMAMVADAKGALQTTKH